MYLMCARKLTFKNQLMVRMVGCAADGVALYSYYVLQNSPDGAHGVSAGIEGFAISSAPMFKSASEAIKQGGRRTHGVAQGVAQRVAQRVALLKELAAEGRFDN